MEIVYRAVSSTMVPISIDSKEFLKQVKCYTTAISTEHPFSSSYGGALDIVEAPEFLDSVRKLSGVEGVREGLTTYCCERCE